MLHDWLSDAATDQDRAILQEMIDGAGAVIPVLLGAGTPLFGPLASAIRLERTDVQVTPAATHLRFRVLR